MFTCWAQFGIVAIAGNWKWLMSFSRLLSVNPWWRTFNPGLDWITVPLCRFQMTASKCARHILSCIITKRVLVGFLALSKPNNKWKLQMTTLFGKSLVDIASVDYCHVGWYPNLKPHSALRWPSTFCSIYWPKRTPPLIKVHNLTWQPEKWHWYIISFTLALDDPQVSIQEKLHVL